LACYDTGKEFPAIIECRVGRGKAILSGVHFEYDPHLLDDNDVLLREIIQSIINDNTGRHQLINHLLHRLDISVN
jgi:Uncharacterized conserved protein